MLEGWGITFNIPDFFAIEGGTGNIEPVEGDSVHGVLHACRDQDLGVLDDLEAVNISYRRIEATVRTYSGRRVRAYVYVGIDAITDDSCLPSSRYRNILVLGALEMKLDRSYVERLRQVPICAPPEYGPFSFPDEGDPEFTLETLARHHTYTGLAGAVFDMSTARPRHRYLRQLLGGRDVTVFFLKRMDVSDGSERLDDVIQDRLTQAQRLYLNDYLHEFAREYRYVGRMRYEGIREPQPDPREKRTHKTRRIRRPSFQAQIMAGPLGLGKQIPAREVLRRAEALNHELDHENTGFLSEACGFMPQSQPRRRMRREHAAWDQAAEQLPSLYRSLRLRRVLDDLPVLPADPEHLDDAHLLRACALLAILAHAYHYVEVEPPPSLPLAISQPWEEVRRRLGRGAAVLSYIDLIVYNWRLVDEHRPDPMRVDNMRLLLPTVDNQEERVFYLTQTEILSHTSPIVGAVVRAQEAAVHDDSEALECALATITSCLERVVRESLLNINPSPSAGLHVDPVVWAKTVAPFAVPLEKGVQGPSGTSSPIFNTLDVFFGRKHYDTFLGKEIFALRDVYPPFWREMLAALHEVSVPEYIAKKGDPKLLGLLHEAVESYAGKNGFLGRHRMKVYGYLEIAFKVGRSVTIGGFSGMFRDRTWDQVDSELEHSRLERLERFPKTCHHASVVSATPVDPEDRTGVVHVVLDVSSSGIRYEAGDRCGILPENRPELVERTLAALGADGSERLPLTEEWRSAVRLRHGYERAEALSIEEVLRFGRIRPVVPRVAEALQALTQDETLSRHMQSHTTHQWELWDLLELLSRGGFDVRRLWQGERGEPSDTLCRIVPPETFRMYSISSVMSSAETGTATEIHLTVGRLRYESSETDVTPRAERYGTASNFLAGAAGRKVPISIIVEHPARFGLPRDPTAPIIMLAAGTGLSPFRGFLVERLRQLNSGRSLLILGLRSRKYLACYERELAPGLESGRLELRVAFSRDDVEPRWDPATRSLRYEPGRTRHVNEILEEDETARTVWDLLQGPGESGGAHLYICGRSRFARTVIESLKALFMRFEPGTEAERETAARKAIYRLVGEGRIMQEIFTDARPAESPQRIFPVSEVVLHNNEERGYWLVIDGVVYDVTEFVHMHPGGTRVLMGYAGMDATEGYARAHLGRSEIDAMREMYEIGSVDQPDFEGISGVVHGPAGPQTMSLRAVYRLWVRALYLSVEMQNALRHDQALQHGVTTRDEPVEPRSYYRLQKSIETHQRFVAAYLDGIGGEPLEQLWTVTRGLFAPNLPQNLVSELVSSARAGISARYVEALAEELHATVHDLVGRETPPDHPDYQRVLTACRMLEELDKSCLSRMKAALRGGVKLFEALGAETLTRGGDALMGRVRELCDLVAGYHGEIERMLGAEWDFTVPGESNEPLERRFTVPAARRRTVLSTTYWTMEEDEDNHVVIICRTPTAVQTLADLVSQNEEVIRRFRPEHAAWGVVVDMRQAPRRNDPAFENAMGRLRLESSRRFARLAVLLESEEGVLQVNRLRRADERDKSFATKSETAAIKFAMGKH
jgi:sulfite reductase (NADPH) flavoprotein alpha-component